MRTLTAGMLPHRLRVWRDSGQRDRFGQRVMEVVPTERGLTGMTQIATDVRCRITQSQGGMAFDERSTLTISATSTIFCELSTDINEADRVQAYEPIHGEIILPDGIVMLVKTIYTFDQPHHFEVAVRTIRGSQEQGESPATGGEGTVTP